ncbi:hypothetical protein BB559_006183 [Furculomyces boomerangus]|uniref:Trafficking protein particle complex subunit n=1 Tax=Furculomyces boomerangus TaxID=61424 RepID=A0A2T9Y4J2_9FUNG|nr:hypothetical protein BB559_006183 [Furculomyces boomerangus]
MSVASAINLLRNLKLDNSKTQQEPVQINETFLELFLIELINSTVSASLSEISKTRNLVLSSNNSQDLSPKTNSETFNPVEQELIQSGLTEHEKLLIEKKLDEIGFRVGQKISERYTAEIQRFVDAIGVIKFICKEIWYSLFNKQIDNLKTNHKGIYIIQDLRFKWITKISNYQTNSLAKEKTSQYLHLVTGMLRGILERVGITSTVTFDIEDSPQCSFQIKITKSRLGV